MIKEGNKGGICLNKPEHTLFTEIRGNRHCLIEGVDKLVRYDDKVISALAGKLVLSVSGNNLTLDLLSENRIGIRGEIKCITYGGENAVSNT
ncbi:MAG: hypothetical protein GX148_06850 [Clostridiales bacterium]|nr:hypothetical protein [Clostridiales bacterium]